MGREPSERYAVVWARTGNVAEMAREPAILGGQEQDARAKSGLPFLYYWTGTTWASEPEKAELHAEPSRARRIIDTMTIGTSHMAVRAVLDARGAS